MSSGFQFADIIFLAMVAVFLVLRLRGVLGRRNGNERPPGNIFGESPEDKGGDRETDNVIRLPERNRRPVDEVGAAEEEPQTPLAASLRAIGQADANFDPDGFIGGARAAFEMIVGAFAAGDIKTLKPLLALEVYNPFAEAIQARTANGEILSTEIIGIRKAEIIEAELRGSDAVITVRFVSEQVNMTKDKDGKVIDGNPQIIENLIDLWTFSRDTRSRDPNWLLISTRVPE
jgi:predicted lipid-binding transport protein (Tim44 family)